MEPAVKEGGEHTGVERDQKVELRGQRTCASGPILTLSPTSDGDGDDDANADVAGQALCICECGG